MMKKITALLLIVMMLLFTMVPAFAFDTADVPEVTIVNHSKKITPQELYEVKNSVGAKAVFNDGIIIPLDSVVTIEDFEEDVSYRSYNAEETPQKSYKVTVQTELSSDNDKIVSDSGDKNGKEYNVSATLQLVWTDGPGFDNYIKKVSGTLTVLKGTVTEAKVSWGDQMSPSLYAEKDVLGKSSFSYNPNFKTANPGSDFDISIRNCLVSLNLHANASIFQ